MYKFSRILSFLTLSAIVIFSSNAMAVKPIKPGKWATYDVCAKACFLELKSAYQDTCLPNWEKSNKKGGDRRAFDECKEKLNKTMDECQNTCFEKHAPKSYD